jgi:hypothetical protein
VYQPFAGAAPDHIYGDDAAMLGEMRGEDVEVAAVARQPMHADDDMVLARGRPIRKWRRDGIHADRGRERCSCSVPAAS